jgi:hypothetical protein
MKKLSLALMFLLALGLTSCASLVSSMKLTPEQQEYVDEVKQFPLDFEIDKTDNEDDWGRAQAFIGKYSDMKLQIVTDYNLQTYNSTNEEEKFAYSVTKTPVGNKLQITIECTEANPFFGKEDAIMNAHILAYYISTGQLHPELVQRRH